ncbi:MAG: PH domain-containing protein [Desulfurococcales archaeon]|nr:PH domain-containing protein [Desulfurococcales archaeon]
MLGNEKVLKETRPTVWGFMGEFAIWIYFFLVTLLFYLSPARLETPICSYLESMGCEKAMYLAWSIVMLVSAAVVSLFRISMKYLVYSAVVILVPVVYKIFGGGEELWAGQALAMLFAGMAFVGIEIHRRAHRYIITDRRIIIQYKGPTTSHRRDLVYERIQEFVLTRPLLGRLLGFGHIYPVTASGIGTGEDAVLLGVGGGSRRLAGFIAKKRGIRTARARSYMSLYAIPEPEETYELLVKLLGASESAPYLRELVNDMKKLVGENEPGEKRQDRRGRRGRS